MLHLNLHQNKNPTLFSINSLQEMHPFTPGAVRTKHDAAWPMIGSSLAGAPFERRYNTEYNNRRCNLPSPNQGTISCKTFLNSFFTSLFEKSRPFRVVQVVLFGHFSQLSNSRLDDAAWPPARNSVMQCAHNTFTQPSHSGYGFVGGVVRPGCENSHR